MALNNQNGFGFAATFIPITKDAGGVRSVLPNVGAARQINAGGSPLRLTRLTYRVDLAPDVAVNTVNVPIYWRLMAFRGDLPVDVSQYQAQAYPAGAHPEIPANFQSAANPIMLDVWLDFSNDDPGLNQLAVIEFPDAGPDVAGNDSVTVILVPLIDQNFPQALPGAANAVIALGVWGTGIGADARNAMGSGGNSKSLPRYDVAIGGA